MLPTPPHRHRRLIYLRRAKVFSIFGASVLATVLLILVAAPLSAAQSASDDSVRKRFVESFVKGAESTYESNKHLWSESQRMDREKILAYIRSLKTDWDSVMQLTLEDVDTDSTQMIRRYHQSFQFYFGDRRRIDQSTNSVVLEPIIWGGLSSTNPSQAQTGYERKNSELVAQWFELVHRRVHSTNLFSRSYLFNKIKKMTALASSPALLEHLTQSEFETILRTLDRFVTIDDATMRRIVATVDDTNRPGDWPISTMEELDSVIHFMTYKRNLMVPTAIKHGHQAAEPYVRTLIRQTRRQLDSVTRVLSTTPRTRIQKEADRITDEISDWLRLLPETAPNDSDPSIWTEPEDTERLRRLARNEGAFQGTNVLELFDLDAHDLPPDASRRLSFFRSILHRLDAYHRMRPSNELAAEIEALRTTISNLYRMAAKVAIGRQTNQ